MTLCQKVKKSAIELAREAVMDEEEKKAVESLKQLYRQKLSAEKIVANIDRQIADLEAAITDGSHVG